jgi:hypothetical protein
MVAYPFFGGVADAVGRLLALQDDVERRAVVRRMYETYGERPFVNRATRAVWNSFVLWGVLSQAERPGRAVRSQPRLQLHPDIEQFLIESALYWSGSRPLPLTSLVSMPCMFPFDMSNASATARTSERVRVGREGTDFDVVRVK